jgi:hypothetical protein
MARPTIRTAVVTTRKTTDMVRTVVMAALRPSVTTSPLCHLDSPHKLPRTASSRALRLVSNKVRLEEEDTTEARTSSAAVVAEAVVAVAVVVVAVVVTEVIKTNAEDTTRATAGEGTVKGATDTEGTPTAEAAILEEVMAATMVAEARAAADATRKSSLRATEQLR